MNKVLYAIVIMALLFFFGAGVITFTLFGLAALALVLLIAIPCYWMYDMRRRNKPSTLVK